MTDAPNPSITPNVVISDAGKRRRLGVILYVLLFLVGLASLLLAFFPELAFGTDIPSRAIAFVTTAVTWTASVFGVAVTLPNIPRR